MASYKPFDKQFKFLAEYKGTDVQHQKDLLNDAESNRVKDALLILASHEMKDYPITIRTSPKRGVFCQEDIENVLLCPSPGNVVKYEPTAKKAPVLEEKNTIRVHSPSGDTMVFFMSNLPLDDKYQNAFGAVQTTSKEADANMKVVVRDVRFVLPTVQAKLKIAGFEHIVKVPCLNSCKPLKKGDELLIFKKKDEAKEAKKKETKAKSLKLELAPPGKKPRKD